MNIGLIDVDGHNFPNLALMRLAAYHKSRGDSVEWWDGFTHYDRVYKSKVSAMLPVIEQAVAYLKEAGVALWRLWCYVLVQDVEESQRRVLALREMGVEPFAQPYRDYDGGEPTAEQKRFARWVNSKAAFRSCTFADFEGGRK